MIPYGNVYGLLWAMRPLYALCESLVHITSIKVDLFLSDLPFVADSVYDVYWQNF